MGTVRKYKIVSGSEKSPWTKCRTLPDGKIIVRTSDKSATGLTNMEMIAKLKADYPELYESEA